MTSEEALQVLFKYKTATEVLRKANEMLTLHPNLKENRTVTQIVVDAAFNMDQRRLKHLRAVAQVLEMSLIEIKPYLQPNAPSLYIRT